MSMDSSFYSSYSDASTEQLLVDAVGNKNNLLPPLMQAVDTYVDSASDIQVQLFNDSTTSTKKKTKGRKAKKKASQLVPEVKVQTLPPAVIPGDLSNSSDRPESRGFSLREGNPLLYSLGRHSAWEDVPPAVPSLDSQWSSTISNSKNMHSDSSSTVLDHGIKLFPISPPAEFNINKSKFSLHSPHRSINAPTVAGTVVKTRDNNNNNNNNNHLLSPVIPARNINNNNNNNNLFIKTFAQSIPANKKSDLGFNRALQSIAAIKLHNFAMRRRNHVTQKLKVTYCLMLTCIEMNLSVFVEYMMTIAILSMNYYRQLLREIRGLQREHAEEMAIAKKEQEYEMAIAKREQDELAAIAKREQEEQIAKAKKEQEERIAMAKREQEERTAMAKREQEEEAALAKKQLEEETLAAWKLRYYIEYLRLNTMRHVVNVVEERNQELESDLEVTRQSASTAQGSINALNDDIYRLTNDVAERDREKSMLRDEWMRLNEELQITRNHVFAIENSVHSERAMQEDLRNSLRNEYSKCDMIRNQLNITRLTCQDLVMSNAQRDNEVYQLKAELRELRKTCDDEIQRRLDSEVMMDRQTELLRMKDEDSAARAAVISQLNDALVEKDALLQEKSKQIDHLNRQLVESSEQQASTMSAITSDKVVIQRLEEERAALQKLLTDTARKANSFEDRLVKHTAKEVELQAGLTTREVMLSVQQQQLTLEQAKNAAAQSSIESLTEENIAKSEELERLNMYGQEMLVRFVSTSVLSHRHNEYSRFLEEELFNARKLYETTSDDFYMTQLYKNSATGAEASGISEESYFYRKQKYESEKEQIDVDTPVLYYLKSFGKGSFSPTHHHQTKPTAPTTPPPMDSGGTEYDDVDPYSPPHNLVAEQRLILVLDALENKLKTVDEAANSLRFLAERADIMMINKQGPLPLGMTDEQQFAMEQERIEQERIEQERIEQERIEQERIEQERIEQERLEQERIEQERIEQEQIEQESFEQKRIKQERIEQEQIRQERIEQERIEQARLNDERIEQERIEQARQLQEQRRLRIQEQRLALLEADRVEDGRGGRMEVPTKRSAASIGMTPEQREHLLHHIEMEGMFYSLQAELEAVNLAVTSQQEDIIALEDEKAFYKDRMKSLKKSRTKSIKMNTLNDAAEQSMAAELSQYSEQIDLIRDRIVMYSKENARLNDRAVEVQTELHDLDIRLEFSATDFFNKYGMDINDEALRSSAQQKVLLNPSPTRAAVDPISSSRFSNSISKITEGGPMLKPSAVSDDDMSKISSLGFDEDGTSSVSNKKKKRGSKNKKRPSVDTSRSRPSVVQELLVNNDQLVVLREEQTFKAGGGTAVKHSVEQSVDVINTIIQRSVDVTAPLPIEDDAVSESGSLLLSSKKSKKKKNKDRSKSSRPSVVQELLGDSSVEEQAPPTERQLFISVEEQAPPTERQLFISGGAAATISAEDAQYKGVTLDRFPFTTSQEQQQPSATTDNVAVKSKSRERDATDGKELPLEATLPTSGQGRRGNMVNNVGVVAVKTPNRNLRDIKLPVKNRYDVPSTKEVTPNTTRPSTADNMMLQSPIGGPEAALSSNRSTILTPIATSNAIVGGTTTTAPVMVEKEESHVHLDDDNYDEMRKEYASVKESLSRWKQDFMTTYQREPTTDDFVNIDVSVQMLILRKDELNQLISQSKSRRRKSTIGGSREKEKSPKRTTKSRSGSIASESVVPTSISSESNAMERSLGPVLHHPSDETLLVEYEDVKQRLALWRQTFVETNNREPTTNDFVTLDIDTQIMILRRDELKQLVSGIKEKRRGASKSKPAAIGGLDAITEAAGDADQSQKEQPLSYDTTAATDTTAAATVTTTTTQSSPPKQSTFSNGGDVVVRGNQSSTSITEDRSVDLSAVASASSSPLKALKQVVGVSEIYNKVDLLSELSSIKKVLSQWRRDFMTNNAGREPSPSDFLLMSPELQSLMLRREEIKAILNAEGEKRVTIVNQDSIYSDGSSRPLDFNPDRMTDKNKSKDNKKKTTHMDTTDLSSLASEVSDITADDDFKYKRDSMEATVIEAPSPLEISSTQSSSVKKQMKKGKKAKKKGGEDGGDGSTLASSITKSTAIADNDDPLRKEYQEVKKYLKRWKADFVREHGREPDSRDLESVGEETQSFIVRQFELKEAMDERDRKATQDELLKKSIKSALHTYHE